MSDIRAKKSLGQNWLVNEGVLDRIIAAARIAPGETVVEVGPGRGALTARLVAAGARVVAIEKDHRLTDALRGEFPMATIIESDVLTADIASLVPGPYKLVANIPYYLTSHLIRLMLESWPPPTLAVLMVQEEVARRMIAAPPDMNLLALSVQLATDVKLVMRVSRGSFRPIPDVDSAVVVLTPRLRNTETGEILALARQAFEHKRKQLKATIPAEALTRAGIEPSRRPQELSLDEWRRVRATQR